MQGEISVYKLIGTRCSESLKVKLFAGGKQFSGPHFDGNQTALTYLIKIGEQKSWSWFKKLRRSENFACLSRLDLPQSTFSGSRKIETVELSRYRFFPFQTGPPNSKVCKVAPRTSCIDAGFLFVQLEESTTIFLPSSCLNREGAGQTDSEKLWNDSCNTSLAVTTAVHTVTDAHHSRFVVNTTFLIDSRKTRWATPTFTMSKPNKKHSSMENSRQINSAKD